LRAGSARSCCGRPLNCSAVASTRFSRYENGKTKPPLALVNLFKLLDRHPELLNEVRTA
jgi:hypothetical protein